MAASNKTSSSSNKTIKLHYGYGGKIVYGNDRIRYHGGTNKIMVVNRDISYTKLIIKLWDTCGPSMRLRFKLPGDDPDLLVLVTSDEDLKYAIEEYDQMRKVQKLKSSLMTPYQLSLKSVKEKRLKSMMVSCA
ncbi:RAF-like serine/threonine-protein kinase PRAF [Rutidosis leptorrhynchoides]|uniref:RAF-like serine/threonine-protein kinase PRAF n=1 Tax=Rutidosis leptorrhynchoides TaxID=125765 RepID=UPI003A98D124